MSLQDDRIYLGMALELAQTSTDPSTKVGCVIAHPAHGLRALATNGLHPLFKDLPERHLRPDKYTWYEHAERAAIYQCARLAGNLNGATLYLASTPVKFPPCADCMRAIIGAGIDRLVTEPPAGEFPKWADSCATALLMAEEAGVAYDTIRLTPGQDSGTIKT